MTSPTDEISYLRHAVAGRYEIVRELGRGGMGVVYLARDIALERPVAIKLLPPALAAQPELRERFMREIRTAAGLSHPNIVPIFSVEERDGLVFYAMGFVDGETLANRVERAGPQSPSEVARVLQEAAWALSYAHGRGIIHRDVKPDNILIEHATGRTFLTDFGIAHLANSTMTAAGVSLGTPHYMSPEQAAGEELDARSDIYSLGIVGYVALTGKLPFDAPTVQAILAMHLILLSFIPIMFLARPAEPLVLGVWLCATVVIVIVQLRARAAFLVREGFGYDDVRAALTLELHQREEERALLRADSALASTGRGRTRYRLIFAGGLALIALGLLLARHSHIHTTRGAGVMAIMAAGIFAVIFSIMLRTGRLFYRERRSARLFARLWEGWFGRAIFRT